MQREQEKKEKLEEDERILKHKREEKMEEERLKEEKRVADEGRNHRRRLYVSGTGAEGAEKRRDVDGVEGWGVPGCPLAN